MFGWLKSVKSPDGEEYKKKGNDYFVAGKLDEAESCYRKALEIAPENAEVCSNLGLLLQARGRIRDAIPLFRKAVEIKPDLVPAHNNLGSALLHLGEIEAAFLIALLFVRETLPWARAEGREKKQGAQANSGAWSVFTLVSFRHPTFRLLCQAGVANKVADALLWVLFPAFLHEKGLDLVEIGWITAVYGLTWGASQLFTGALSDRVGRKKPIVAGLWILGIGVSAVTLVEGITAWIGCAAIMGAGMALLYPNLIAAVADLSHPEWRSTALGTYRYWRDTGYAIGAFLLGLVAQIGGSIRAAFWTTALVLLISGLLMTRGAEESHPGRKKT